MKVTADGLEWEVDRADHDMLGPSHEPELTSIVLDLIPAGGVFLDVGAHVGHYALRAARKCSKVIAVEPNPATAERLRHNALINRLGNVHIAQVAAWDGVARLQLHRVHEPYQRDGSAFVTRDNAGRIWGARLDDLLSQYPLRPDRLDVVKLDVEGSDIRALEGMAGLLARHRPVLVIEDHSYLGYYPQDELLSRLSKLSYLFEDLPLEGGTWWQCTPARAASTPRAPA